MKKLILLVISMFALVPSHAEASIGAGGSTMPIYDSICSGSKWESVRLSDSHGITCTANLRIPAGRTRILRVQCPASIPSTGYKRGTYLPIPAQEWMVFATHPAVRWDGDIFGKTDGIVTRIRVKNWTATPQRVVLGAGCHSSNTNTPRFDWGISQTPKFRVLMESRSIYGPIASIPWVNPIPSSPPPSSDILVTSASRNGASGSGDDTIIGTHAGDRSVGGNGNDELRSWSGHDKVYGGPGHDVVMGQAGNDVLSGGPGNDYILDSEGVDHVVAGPGNDFVNVKDGNTDRVDCGPGFDVAVVDSSDVVRGCERVRR